MSKVGEAEVLSGRGGRESLSGGKKVYDVGCV
jgi:hypothetical protein